MVFRVTYVTILAIWITCAIAEISQSYTKDNSAVCEENWTFLDGFCYYFSDSDETVNPINANDQCFILEAEHAFPKSKKELSFMQAQAKARTTYGWIINMERRFSDDSYATKIEDSWVEITPEAESIPELQKSFERDNKCVALHVGNRAKYNLIGKDKNIFYSRLDPGEISTEPCEVDLWVVCQAEKSKLPKQELDYVKWFGNDKLIFWLSWKMANQADAESLCKQENMELITSVDDLMESLNGTYDVTPWWTGFTLGQNGPIGKDGKELDLSVVPWLSQRSYGMPYIALLHSGNTRYVPYSFYDVEALPYICKKRAQGNGLFGCPNLWVRAGRSCYSISKYKAKTWSEAKETCEARGSHLLSINSLDEKLWIETVKTRDTSTMWTSANDIDNEGQFTWHDGSAIDGKVLSWQKGPFNDYWGVYSTDCITFGPYENEIAGRNCKYDSYPACQYELDEGESSCEDEWSKFNGTCYFLDTSLSNKLTYQANLKYCMGVLTDRQAIPLILKTKEIADFLSNISKKSYYIDYWLGMSRDNAFSTWRWYDSTIVDFTVFGKNDQPDNGNGKEPENCVAINAMVQAYDTSCDNQLNFICEKDLAPVTALGFQKDDVSTLCPNLPMILALEIMIVFCRL